MLINKVRNLAPLDGLRGVAIAAVFLFHIAELGAFKGLPWLQDLMLAGWLGVDLFFAISGFLITRSAVGLLGKPNYFRTFYKSRARRILPAYLTVLIVLTVLFNLIYRDSQYIGIFNDRIPCLVFMCTNMEAALTSIANPFGVNHFWSLAVEVQIYIFWPVVVSMLSRKALLVCALSIALLSFGCRLYVLAGTGNWMFIYFSTVTRLDSFAMGAAVFLMSESARRRSISYVFMVVGICGEALVAYLNSGIPFSKASANVFGITFAAFLSAGVVLAVVTDNAKIISRLLLNKYLMALGVVSYSLYILHYPIMHSRSIWVMDKDFARLGESVGQDFAMFSILAVVCLAGAALSYRILEKPFLSKKAIKETPTPVNTIDRP